MTGYVTNVHSELLAVKVDSLEYATKIACLVFSVQCRKVIWSLC